MNDTLHKIKIDKYFILMLISVISLLTVRNTGLYPTVFADEYTYSKFSRLLSLSESTLPNYLFLFIYKITNLCESGFLDCARFLNVLFFSLASTFIYLISTKFTGNKTSLLIALLSVLAPINTYTAFFMPESFYYLSFWAFTYLALSIKKNDHISHWLFMGMVFGLSALIKPHALLLSPAIVVYFFVMQTCFFSEKIRKIDCFKLLGFIATTIFTKLIIGFVLAGHSGVTIFGATYASMASGALDSGHYINLVKMAFSNLKGHLLSLCLLFSVPVCQLLFVFCCFLKKNKTPSNTMNIILYTFLILSSLLIIVPLFTASVSGSGPYETVSRLHIRYYSFTFPLFLLVAAAQLTSNGSSIPRKWRALVGLTIAMAIIYAVKTKLLPYTPNFIDSPEIRGFTANLSVFYTLSFLSVLSLAFWVYSNRLGTKFFLYLFMPVAICFSTMYVNSDLRGQIIPDEYDNASIFSKRYFTSIGMSNEDIVTKVAIVGTGPAGLFQALFHLDNSNISMEGSKSAMFVTPDIATYDLSTLPLGKEWAVVIGDYPQFKNVSFQLPLNGFTLVKLLTPIDFTKSTWPGVISKTQGLSSAESWGTWSVGDVVKFEFYSSLPEKFNVHLTAHAFGPNVGKEFVAKVGETSQKFKLGQENEEIVLTFDNIKEVTTLQLTVPTPSSPKMITDGQNGDERNLGIGLVQMKIEPLE